MRKITIKELSDYCIVSMSDEQTVYERIGCGADDNIIQAMVDYLIEREPYLCEECVECVDW